MLQRIPGSFSVCAFALLTTVVVPSLLAADKVDPSGTWKWTREVEGEKVESVLKLKLEKDKLTGRYTRGELKSDVQNAKLDGDKLSFDVVGKVNGTDMKAAFNGKVADEKITGTVQLSANGQSGELEWEAKRALDLDDVLGKWQLRVESNEGRVYEPILTLKTEGKEPSGSYLTQELGEFKIKDIKISGRELTFKVDLESDGQTFPVVYVAKPAGDAMKGNVTLDFGGQTVKLDFTGKRVVEAKKETQEKKE